MVRFFAVAGNSCLAIRSVIVFVTIFWLRERDLCQLFHENRCQKVVAKLLLGKGRPIKQ